PFAEEPEEAARLDRHSQTAAGQHAEPIELFEVGRGAAANDADPGALGRAQVPAMIRREARPAGHAHRPEGHPVANEDGLASHGRSLGKMLVQRDAWGPMVTR